MSPPPRYIFLSSVTDQIVKTNRPGHQRMKRLINGVGSAGTPWSVTPAVYYSAYFQGIMLETLLCYNTEPFKRDIFSHLFKNCCCIFDHGTTF